MPPTSDPTPVLPQPPTEPPVLPETQHQPPVQSPVAPGSVSQPAVPTQAPLEGKRTSVVWYEHIGKQVPVILEWEGGIVRLFRGDVAENVYGSLVFEAPVAQLSRIKVSLTQLRIAYNGKDYNLDFDRARTVRMGLANIDPALGLAGPALDGAGLDALDWWIQKFTASGQKVTKMHFFRIVFIGTAILVLGLMLLALVMGSINAARNGG